MDADPTTEPASSPWRKTRVTLETGGWWEVLPGDMEHFDRHARAYVASKTENPEAQARVRKVWLMREYAPAWQKRGPAPPPRMGGKKLVQTSSAVVDNATGEVVEDEAPF